jgi:hypothetical protein
VRESTGDWGGDWRPSSLFGFFKIQRGDRPPVLPAYNESQLSFRAEFGFASLISLLYSLGNSYTLIIMSLQILVSLLYGLDWKASEPKGRSLLYRAAVLSHNISAL